MNEPVDTILENSRRQMEEFRRQNEAREKRMSEAISRSEDLSMSNFATWKDYLHRYYVVMLTFLSFIITLTGTDTIQPSTPLFIGSLALGASIIIGFIGIHWYLFVERKWIYISTQMSAMPAAYGERMMRDEETVDNPESLKFTNPVRTWREKDQKDIQALKEKIRSSDNKAEKATYRMYLRNLHRENKYIKYVGATFGGWIETVWFGFVIISTTSSFIGLGLIFFAIVKR